MHVIRAHVHPIDRPASTQHTTDGAMPLVYYCSISPMQTHPRPIRSPLNPLHLSQTHQPSSLFRRNYSIPSKPHTQHGGLYSLASPLDAWPTNDSSRAARTPYPLRLRRRADFRLSRRRKAFHRPHVCYISLCTSTSRHVLVIGP